MKNPATRFLTIAVIFLLIANIALVAFMFFGKGRREPGKEGGKGGPFEKLAKEVGMSDTQKKSYDSLREVHFSRIRPIFDTIRQNRQALFNLMKEETANDSLVNIYTSHITEQQSTADKLTLQHFRRVRSLLDPAQQQKYDDFIQGMIKRGGSRTKKDSSIK